MADATTSGVVPERVDALVIRARKEVDDGLLPAAQIAVALDGEVVVDETFGLPPQTRFVPYSCSKVLTAAAIWRLLGDGPLEITDRVVDHVPSFGANGKDVVTVEQVLLHTCGFPMAPLGPPQWATREGRQAAFARWRLTLPPGEVYVYHPTAAHWVLCEIIEVLTGAPYTDAIHRLVTEPLGLPRLLGIPHDQQDDIAPISAVGEPLTSDEVFEATGIRVDPNALDPAVATAALLTLSDAHARAVGVPGGGAVVRAADLARLYQGLLHNPGELWDPKVLADGTANVRSRLPDPTGIPANRALGLVVAGDDGFAHLRGFGKEASPRAFGHNGAGGQIAFADPDSGLSICYVTNALDQDVIRQSRRDTAIASRASLLTTPY